VQICVYLWLNSLPIFVRPPQFPLRKQARGQKIVPMAAGAVTRVTHQRARSFIAACLSVAFFWTLLLSASPKLHARVHVDSGQPEHVCAATLIASGNYEHAVPAPLVRAAVPVDFLSKIPALAPLWVESPFLQASVLEHAPPFCS
jgi:hypothetical protein